MLFLFSIPILSAQPAYTPAGRSSFAVSLGFSSDKDATSLNLGSGFSILGWGGIEFGYSAISFEEKFFGEEISASAVTFSVSLLMIKQSAQIPLSIELSLLFGGATYDSYALDYFKWDMSAGIFGFGFILHHRADLSPSFALAPSAGFVYTNTSTTIEDKFGNSLEESDKEAGLSLGLGFLFSITRSSTLVFKPSLFFADGNATFGIRLSVLGVF